MDENVIFGDGDICTWNSSRSNVLFSCDMTQCFEILRNRWHYIFSSKVVK